ncbi:DUF3087 domain-containing protein [Shewanella colwelliana]|uniref:DUF3087 family protein n=1 Tax=Shewanella colwelliana TaxID=23 RepID=UPI001BB991E2|nr:DUF3087 family protein [Shewanella colwelliana]GIU20378.1 DUF3087 domain-containing protein [Shewanella colwelliana]
MQLIDIDKTVYRKHLNRVITVFVASLAILSVLLGQLLIQFFGQTQVASGESTGNLHLNVLGVLVAVIICAGTLYSQREHIYFKEVFYVSRLKALQNRIYRKLKSIKQQAEKDDVDALITLSFYYASLKFVYLLDDNTLTLNQVDSDFLAIKQQIQVRGLNVDERDFKVEMLTNF